MIELTKQRIILEMRKNGDGYKKIANELGLSRDTVRSYCLRNGLDNPKNVCKQCNKKIELAQTGRKRLFCSDECRHAWWNHNREMKNRKAIYRIKCQHCKIIFESYGNKNRRYCGRDCYFAERFQEAKAI